MSISSNNQSATPSVSTGTPTPSVSGNEPAPSVSQPSQPSVSAPVNDLMSALTSVDPNAPDAGQNATSIDDGNGGRIELNFDKPAPQPTPVIIKK